MKVDWGEKEGERKVEVLDNDKRKEGKGEKS